MTPMKSHKVMNHATYEIIQNNESYHLVQNTTNEIIQNE